MSFGSWFSGIWQYTLNSTGFAKDGAQPVYLSDGNYTPTDPEFEHDREKHIVTIRKPGAYVFREFHIDIHT
uniref:Uncharacterized protein n=1 Tax=Acrobeloides nanus TaxID=290746 RepID=A0A914E865_9BILA